MPRKNLANFPPLPDRPAPFPAEPPLSRGLAEPAGWWLDVQCSCGRGATFLPLRLMAAACHGWRTPLAALLPRLHCRRCRQRPLSVELIEDPAADAPGRGGGPPGKRLRLI